LKKNRKKLALSRETMRHLGNVVGAGGIDAYTYNNTVTEPSITKDPGVTVYSSGCPTYECPTDDCPATSF
jgi:hypothetical protein